MTNEPVETTKTMRSRGIYLLPNLVTIGSMFAGFYAIIAGLQGRYENAVIAIFTALILDGLDGRIARWTHAVSEMGAQMDSLADMVSFGIAPAMVMYSWSLSILGKPGWLVAFIYTVCTALRLARFNSQAQGENKRYFFGLNTPSSAALVASTIWTFAVNDINGIAVAIPMAVLMFLLGLLKVSTIRYRSFKDIDLRNKRVSLVVIIIAILVLALIALDPPEMLFFLVLTYVISGPVNVIWRFFRHRKLRAKK
ncbi:MAG: CDP-diacylglycerol--serine O-phosphatidyltransferase [Gammaproteobacteria bacterium RIFCSPHIGHO2_12_FULL_41_15]|nr:MAG: CDP-diacylglycerol--serine O-phosphatidyltransferase [Gammaproteobacteria bacterium RIFCSPHIGHO2_12_FULL_41_15]